MRRLASALLLLLAACGSDSRAPSAADDPRPRSEGATGPIAYPARDYAETAPGRPGGTLRMAAARDNGTLDAHLLADTNTKWLGRLVFDNLVYLGPDGRITPWLARSWQQSPDGLRYTFRLRDGVTFSDGAPFDAEAVRANLARIRAPATKTAMTTAYIAPFVEGRAVDRLTYEARLSEPYAPFLSVLAQSWFGMVSPKQIRDAPATIATAPVGTGPFIVERYARQRFVSFRRREDYGWAPDVTRHRGPAYLERIELSFVPEAIARSAGLASGAFDLIHDVPPQSAPAIRDNPELVLRNRINLGNPVRGLTFNVEKPPFDDVRVRRALALGIDRSGVTKLTGFGEFAPTPAFLSSTTPYRDLAAAAPLRTNVADSNRLLDEAGWTGRDADGFRTRNGRRLGASVLASDASLLGAALVAIQSDARRLGFDLRIEPVTPTQMSERRRAGDYQAFGPGYWHTNTPDGLYIVYHSRQITSPAYTGQNVSRLRDPLLDDLLARARRGGPPARLAELYARAQARLAALVPAVPLFENHTLVAHRAGVRGLIFDTSHNTPRFETVWLEDRRS